MSQLASKLPESPMVRAPELLLALVTDLAVTANFAFQPRDGLQFCNCYAAVATAALRCPIPPFKANKQAAWLGSEEGRTAGWMPVDAETARQRADLGYPAVAVWQNPNPDDSGHIALLVPSPRGVPVLHISQAGKQCFIRAPLTHGFGSHWPKFFTHQ